MVGRAYRQQMQNRQANTLRNAGVVVERNHHTTGKFKDSEESLLAVN